MILDGPISLLDCLVYLIFLTPQLIIQVGLFKTITFVLQALPFLLLCMPYELVRERYFLPACPPKASEQQNAEKPDQPVLKSDQATPFVAHASFFQDLVIRCVRYAFANMPATIGVVFFCKPVALPFMRWRMLRHGYIRSPVHYEQIEIPRMPTSKRDDADSDLVKHNIKAIYLVADPSTPPDVLIYYLHGGGFSMGSSYFYLEFLVSWITLLQTRSGYANPAIVALEYSLVPHAVYPTQLHEVQAGYGECIRRMQGQSEQIVLAGDSAGATLALSLLLSLASFENEKKLGKPGFATLISPWCELVSGRNRDTRSDYLAADSLHMYARQYVGEHIEQSKSGAREKKATTNGHLAGTKVAVTAIDDPIASPGNCTDIDLWRRASPLHGYHFIFGREEVFAPNAQRLVERLSKAGSKVLVTNEEGQIHAWPVVSLFLKDTRADRLQGLVDITDRIGKTMPRH